MELEIGVISQINNESELTMSNVYEPAQTLAIFQYIFNVIHLFINIYFTYGIYSTSLMHPNLKTLILTIATQYSFIAIGRIGQLLSSTMLENQPLILTNSLCIFFKLINDSALIISCTSVLLIGIERLLATVKKQNYSYKGGFIGYAMLGMMICIGIIFSLSTLIYDMLETETTDIFRTKTSCQTLFLHPFLLPLCWFFAGVTFLIGTFLLSMLYRYNLIMQQKFMNDSLTIRYQYNENIATLKVLIPAVAGYGVMILLGVGISIYAIIVLIQTNKNNVNIQIAFQILYMIADLYGLYFIGYIFLKFRPMNVRLRKHVRWLLKLPMTAAKAVNPFVGADPNYVSDFYFKQLTDAWNKGPKINGAQSKNVEKKQMKSKKEIYRKSTSSPEQSSTSNSRMFLG